MSSSQKTAQRLIITMKCIHGSCLFPHPKFLKIESLEELFRILEELYRSLEEIFRILEEVFRILEELFRSLEEIFRIQHFLRIH